MLWLWVLGILAALLVLVCLIRVGAQVTLAEGAAVVDARVSLLHIRVFPGKWRPETEEKQKTKTAGDTEKRAEKALSFAEIQEAGRTLWPPLKRALARTRRGILVKPMHLAVTLGGMEDPAGAAQIYGWIQAAVWTGMPELERVLDIRDLQFHVDVDFCASETALEGTVGITLRIGTLLAVAFGVGIPALRWFLQNQKRRKKAAQMGKAAA